MSAERVTQEKMNALTARVIHERRLTSLRRRILSLDILALVVPVSYFPIRFAAKGTSVAPYAEGIWFVLAALLVVLALLKLLFRIQDRAERHGRLIGENISLITHADRLLSRSTSPTRAEMEFFLYLADSIQKQDRDLLHDASMSEKQEAYRQALKEITPDGKARCPVCGASPWAFSPGSCQACGNTPAISQADSEKEMVG